MAAAGTAFDCLLITRPRPEAEDLAERLCRNPKFPPLRIVLQPAHEFCQADISDAGRTALQSAAEEDTPPLLVFTSTRAVHFALQQLPLSLLGRCQLAAIGAATATALQQAGLGDVLQPEAGYRSEDLLQTLDSSGLRSERAWIVAAAAGRNTLLKGLRQRGLEAHMLLVYRRLPAAVDPAGQAYLADSRRILSVWTSADAMQRLCSLLSPTAWQKVCAGEWLVVSQRLARSAERYRAAVARQSTGPGNDELAAAITEICAAQ
jgi:uroporphyrinogen-III synthase